MLQKIFLIQINASIQCLAFKAQHKMKGMTQNYTLKFQCMLSITKVPRKRFKFPIRYELAIHCMNKIQHFVLTVLNPFHKSVMAIQGGGRTYIGIINHKVTVWTFSFRITIFNYLWRRLTDVPDFSCNCSAINYPRPVRMRQWKLKCSH